jgi:hypothetical protein
MPTFEQRMKPTRLRVLLIRPRAGSGDKPDAAMFDNEIDWVRTDLIRIPSPSGPDDPIVRTVLKIQG